MPGLFLGATASGFNLQGLYYQKRMFQNACMLLTTPSRACMQSVFCCPNERLLAHVFNKERSKSGEERWRKTLTTKGNKRRDEDG